MPESPAFTNSFHAARTILLSRHLTPHTVARFTDTDDVPLMDVLESLKTLENGKKSSVDYKKADGDELREYFAKVLPNFDRDRVHSSDIKKLIQWYNILIENGISDFKEEMKPTEGDNIDDRKDAE